MSSQRNTRLHEGYRPLSVRHFLILLVLLLVFQAFSSQLKSGPLIDAFLMTFVLLSAVLAVGGRRVSLIVAAILVAPPLISRWADHLRANQIPHSFTLATGMIFIAYIMFHLLRFILRAPRVNDEVVCAGISVYLLIALIWAFAYSLVARLAPGSFVFPLTSDPLRAMVGFEAIYFSFETLTTVDFGDIIPVTRIARTLVMAEAVVGVFYMAILIARLVSLYTTDAAKAPAQSAPTDRPRSE